MRVDIKILNSQFVSLALSFLRCKVLTLALPTELRRNIYQKRKPLLSLSVFCVGDYLSSQPVTRQVFSA